MCPATARCVRTAAKTVGVATVSCACSHGTPGYQGHLLPADATHYVMPDEKVSMIDSQYSARRGKRVCCSSRASCLSRHVSFLYSVIIFLTCGCVQVAMDYLEILEMPELSGIIFLQVTNSVMRVRVGQSLSMKVLTCALQNVVEAFQEQKDKMLHRRFNNLLRDERRYAVAFSNLFCQDTFEERAAGESMEQYGARLALLAAAWYRAHLDHRIPIVILAHAAELAAAAPSPDAGVVVLGVKEYLQQFHGQDKTLLDLYASVTEALDAARLSATSCT